MKILNFLHKQRRVEFVEQHFRQRNTENNHIIILSPTFRSHFINEAITGFRVDMSNSLTVFGNTEHPQNYFVIELKFVNL